MDQITQQKATQQMNKIKYIGVILLVFFLSLNAFSQTEYIILWDVTWSMKGVEGFDGNSNPRFNKEKDIWDETKLLLKDVIREIPLDGKSTISVGTDHSICAPDV